MKWVGQADRFVFDQSPACVKTADVIGDVSCEEAVFPSLDLLFQLVTVVGELRLFAGDGVTRREPIEEGYHEDEPTLTEMFVFYFVQVLWLLSLVIVQAGGWVCLLTAHLFW